MESRVTALVRYVLRSSTGVLLSTIVLAAPAAWALKYAEPAHDLKPDPDIPVWKPAPLDIEPEESLTIVGADVMDEMTLGWVKMMRHAYPRLSVTMEARASGTGGPGLTNGTSDAAPVGRELLPAEHEAFVKKFGYEPTAIRVATGSVGSLGKTAASIVMVDKDNPVECLSLTQLDGIYSAERKRGGPAIRNWGELGLAGDWANRPIHLYGLRRPNGIEQYFQKEVLLDGAYRDDIEFVKGKGFTHAFNVAADKMAQSPGGLSYALLANVQPNVKVVPLSFDNGGACVAPTTQTIYDHSYPLSRYVYVFVNKAPGKPVEPKIKEFLRAILSWEGQLQVANDRVYIPLMPEVVREELAKVDQL
jgi:phosphate transport system substrate-binding protein